HRGDGGATDPASRGDEPSAGHPSARGGVGGAAVDLSERAPGAADDGALGRYPDGGEARPVPSHRDPAYGRDPGRGAPRRGAAARPARWDVIDGGSRVESGALPLRGATRRGGVAAGRAARGASGWAGCGPCEPTQNDDLKYWRLS